MRKFFMIAVVGALALLMAAPAMALDFKFGSEDRVRFFTGVNVGFDDVTGSNPRGAQIRLRPRFTVTDDNGNIEGTLRLEIGDVTFGNGGGADNGPTNLQGVGTSSTRTGPSTGGSLGTDGVNVETKWAYIDALMPFGIPARARAGLQPWLTPKGIIVDSDAAGVRLYGQTKPFSYEAFWYRIDGDGTNTLDDNYDAYGGRFDVAIAPFINPGIYYIYARNATARVENGVPGAAGPANLGFAESAAETHYIGATVTGKLGIVSYDLDFVYGVAEGGNNGAFDGEHSEGWVADAAVHFPLGPVTLNIAGTYATGDEANGGEHEAFPGGFNPGWNGPGGGFEMIGNGGAFDAVEYTQDGPTNLWAIGAWVTYNPVKALTLKAAYAFAGFVESDGNCATPNANLCYGPSYAALVGEDTLGQEISLRADYDIWTGFKLQGQVGWLIPTEGDTAAEYVLQMLYNF
jgi:hypothetical protein